ncbi:MAG TPA: ABC transporter permease [Dehalococcoidia bacterium]|nr:ABC transporter permease [Dehalococcoidia bacterium]
MDREKKNRVITFLRRLVREKPLGTVGGILVLLLFLTAMFADLGWLGMPNVGLAPYPYRELHVADKLQPSSSTYVLGTDQLGRDVLSRIIYGARISVFVGVGASILNMIVGAVIGIISGYLGGRFDLIVQRFVDAFLSLPPLILLISVMSIVGVGLVQIIFVLGITGGIGWSRTVRSAVFSIKENVYMEAAEALGATTWRIVFRHVLPNVMPVLLIAFSISMAGNILTEASLSFLGVGIPPPHPTWGQMLSLEGRKYMLEATWLAIWPGVALTIAVFGISMWGDAVRDLVDPRLRGGVGGMGGHGMEQAKKALVRLEKKGVDEAS